MKPTWEYNLTATQESALDAINTAEVAYTIARSDRVNAVVRAHNVGCSWELIARELGLTRQGAWDQFHRYCKS